MPRTPCAASAANEASSSAPRLVDRGERLDAAGGAGGRAPPSARRRPPRARPARGERRPRPRSSPSAARRAGASGEALVDVGVRIEAARQHVAATRIQLPRAGRRLADRHHAPALDQDVGAVEHAAGATTRPPAMRSAVTPARRTRRPAPARTTLRATSRSAACSVTPAESRCSPSVSAKLPALQLEQAEIAGRPGRQCPQPGRARREPGARRRARSRRRSRRAAACRGAAASRACAAGRARAPRGCRCGCRSRSCRVGSPVRAPRARRAR